MENEIIQGTIRYYDSKEEARRLLLVAGRTENGEYICFNITSDKKYKDNGRYPGSVFIAKTKDNGLRKDSFVKTDVEYIIDPKSVYSDVKKMSVKLNDTDYNRVMARHDMLKGQKKVKRIYNTVEPKETEFEVLRRQVIKEVENYKRDPKLMAEIIDFKAKFHRYSFNNVVLLHMQNRGATFVAGFRRWKELGYNVKRGEKSLKILVPYEVTYYKDAKTKQSKNVRYAPREILDRIYNGEIETLTRTYFTTGSVFDISQTDCPPSNYPKFFDMGYESAGHAAVYDSIKAFAVMSGFKVIEDEINSIALKGFYKPSDDTITINSRLEDSEKVATITHELSHAIMHKTSTQPKEVLEFEAECLSHMIQRRLNLPLSEMGKDYLATYYGKIKGNDIQLDKSFRRISKAYDHITTGIDKVLGKKGISIGYEHEHGQEKEQSPKMTAAQQITENFLKEI